MDWQELSYSMPLQDHSVSSYCGYDDHQAALQGGGRPRRDSLKVKEEDRVDNDNL